MTSQQLFDKARFSDVKNLEKSDIYTVGAHVWTGDHQKARWLAEDLLPKATNSEKSFLLFHLGLSHTRTSNYKKAAGIFKDNLRLAQQQPSHPEIQFFAYQGLGFFNFFFSRHRQSLKATYQAHKSLLSFSDDSSKPLYKILCLDLEGHNLIHRYRIHQGLETLERAKALAELNDIQSISQSLALSLLCYKSRYIDKPSASIETLKKALSELPSNNDYSRAEMIFEISNSLMLKGEYSEAQNFLSQNYKVVYESDNKRQMGQLNFRMTYNMFRQGSFEQALFLAKTARSNLNKITDRGLIAQIIGLEIKILKAMGEPVESSLKELASVDEKIDSLLVKRSNARALNQGITINKGEDRFGDIVERLSVNRSVNLYEDVIKNEMYGLLGDFFNIPSGQEAIVLNAPKSHTVVCLKKRTHVVIKPLGNILIKLIESLASQALDKEQIIEKVWGYSDYSPLRHDQLIYSSITRVRNLLGLSDQQLAFDGEKYQLHITVKDAGEQMKAPDQVDDLSKNKEKISQQSLKKNDFVMNIDEELNIRQVNTIKDEQFDDISVKRYSTHFDVTTMTALRDMKKLCELGYLKKIGKGRATRYLKTYSV